MQKGYRQKVRGPRNWDIQKIQKIEKIQKLLEEIPRDEIVDVEPLYNQKFPRKPRLTHSWEKRDFQGPLVHYPTAKVCS